MLIEKRKWSLAIITLYARINGNQFADGEALESIDFDAMDVMFIILYRIKWMISPTEITANLVICVRSCANVCLKSMDPLNWIWTIRLWYFFFSYSFCTICKWNWLHLTDDNWLTVTMADTYESLITAIKYRVYESKRNVFEENEEKNTTPWQKREFTENNVSMNNAYSNVCKYQWWLLYACACIIVLKYSQACKHLTIKTKHSTTLINFHKFNRLRCQYAFDE